MKLHWRRGAAEIAVENNGKTEYFPVSNAVRNVANGRRSLENPEDVVWTTPDDGSKPAPYLPTGFPAGGWLITAVLARTSDYLAPWFILTNAWKVTPEWSLAPAGDYDKPTGKLVRDSGFGLHYAKGTSTTLGCLRFLKKEDLIKVAEMCQVELKAGRKIALTVTE